MKGFKFSKKAKERTEPNTTATSGKLRDLWPGLGAAAGGLLAAALVLWFGIINDNRQLQHEQLSQAWGGSRASIMQQALNQLSNDTLQAARDPQLISALQSGDSAQVQIAERSLAYRDGGVAAHLNLTGRATQNSQGPAPMNFAALDLLRRTEAGQAPDPEAYKVGKQWLIYSAAPLRASDDQPVLGTLLLVVDLQRLLAVLPPLPNGVGQLQIIQQFGKSPAQVLASIGQAGNGKPITMTGSNPNWQYIFTPGPALNETIASPLLLILSVLLALGGAMIGLRRLQESMHRHMREDSAQLQLMVQELAAGKSIKAFSLQLPALGALGKALARLPQRRQATGTEPAAAKPTTSTESEYPLAPTFNGDDILDIDILDDDMDMLGLDQGNATGNNTPASLPASIFRAYDIRGVVGDTLTTDYAYWIGRAIGSESLARGEPGVLVARDGRLSGPELSESLIKGLLDCGCNVTDIGMVPTPVLYFATHVLDAHSGVMVTGSHNPPDYNGFKIVLAGDTLANEEITALHTRLEQNDLASGVGSLEQLEILDRYFNHIRDDIAIAKPLKVVVDCGNGVAGVIAPQLIDALGCTVIPLFCDVDGTFPNHHPDPGKIENLQDLIAKVKAENADLGLAFDGDGDRVGVVTNDGNMIYPDRLMMLFAKDVVSRNPGADVIFDVKCTRRLGALISSYGGRPVMWKTGHSLIKKKMKETGALLAGEMSGHIFFKERWFGFDDGIYSAARLLEILSLENRAAEQVFSAFPVSLSTPEINIQVTDANKFKMIERLQKDGQWGAANLTTLDGVRVDYPHGWGLVRASNTTPMLVLRFEADNEEELTRIKQLFRSQLHLVAPDLSVPF